MTDREILRELFREYAEFAMSGVCEERIERYKKLNALQTVRPPVLVFEIPWGEIDLGLRCEDESNRSLERWVKMELYKIHNFQGDYAVRPYYRVQVSAPSSGNGLSMQVDRRSTMAQYYHDQIPDEAALEKVKLPEVVYDREATQKSLDAAGELLEGIMPVRKGGVCLYMASWDQIPMYHGVENCLIDLVDRPEFAHALIRKFTDINMKLLDEYERLNILSTDQVYNHCTPAPTYELPVKDIDTERVTAKDVWCRAMAQLFAVVSPDTHEEFDLVYTQELFDRCGLSYYGCCEPLDTKIGKLRRFKNLRRVSITPWANASSAAEQMGKDYVLSYKPNPAFVASPVFDPEPVRKEITGVLKACRRSGTPCEFILKDISTVGHNPRNLTDWVDTVNSVIDNFG